MNLAGYIEHTFLKPTALLADIKKVCAEAKEYSFAGVCIPPPFVKNAKGLLEGSGIKVVTVIGFPFGYSIARAKIFETQQAIDDGADELDMVINLIALKNKTWKYLESEVRYIVEAAHKKDRMLKVIIESGALTDEEIIKCCELYTGCGVDYLKTSTGYAEEGATTEAVSLMRQHLPLTVKIKASGGIRTAEFAKQLIEAGADRLGCSAGVAIVKDEQTAPGTGY